MPALNYNRLYARTDAAGRNFAIIFGTAAVLVVVSCLIFGYVLPKYWRKRPPRPSPAHFAVPGDFPSHPAVCRHLRKRPSSQLKQYDPRSETPFPFVPPIGESISLPSITPRSHSAADLYLASNGLFSPARDRQPSRRGPVSQTELSYSPTGQPSAGEHDYSLALPDPCLLRARSAGKAPPLRKHLERFPVPRSASGNTDKLAHPNKLFRDLELRDSQTSIVTPTPLPASDEQDVSHPTCESSIHHTSSQIGRADSSRRNPSNTFTLPQEYELKHWKLRRLERRGTWSSSARLRPTRSPIGRAVTVMKVKTPVADTRSLCGNKNSLEPPSSKSGAITSSEYKESTLSSQMSLGSPPTSPIDVPKLINQPESVLNEKETMTSYLGLDRGTRSSAMLPSSDRHEAMCSIPEGRPADVKKASIFKQVPPLARNRPARLNLAILRKSPPLRKQFQRRSMSSVGSLLVPLVKSKRPSIQASSIYSRDTLGVSIIRSPVSPAFTENTFAGASNSNIPGPVHRKSSSMDLLKTKIDDWRLDLPESETFSMSSASEFKRAPYDIGPYSPTFPDSAFGSVHKFNKDPNAENTIQKHLIAQKDVPTICIGRASDDIFRDPVPDIESGRVLKQILDVEVAASRTGLFQVPQGGTAPGGADWV